MTGPERQALKQQIHQRALELLGDRCRHCLEPFERAPGRTTQLFCSTRCRNLYWQRTPGGSATMARHKRERRRRAKAAA